ncbi:hypothetical protein [Allohahella marinimesophila]|uniref:NHL repeat containing protein n=1 Tax=Allohahella marinimesophila TaxID=1054972 RepID=A0ABP7Q0L2_9GAMM
MLALGTAAGIAGCDNDDNDDKNRTTPPALETAQLYLSANGAASAGTVTALDTLAAAQRTFQSGNNEGILIDASGDALHAGDGSNIGLRTICRIDSRPDGAVYDETVDRELAGPSTGMVNPKGIATAEASGLVFIADFGASKLSVFGKAADGDASPLGETPLAVKPWDLAYDEAADRLFVALTDGTIAVYDGYVASGYVGTAMRTITPANANAEKISTNLHGIAYEAASDRLVVSDVGDANVATDGALFVLSAASTADGLISVDRQIAGPSTSLGNPVDLTLDGTTMRIAEKSNDLIITYADIFAGASGDVAPDYTAAADKPESLALVEGQLTGTDGSDLAPGAEPRSAVVATSNPATVGPGFGMVSSINLTLDTPLASFDSTLALESTAFDIAGDAYSTFDSNSMGGLLVTGSLASERNGDSYTASRDRMITGMATTLTAPKGLDVASQAGLVFVAENDAASAGIKIFSACAGGDVAPLMTLTASGGIQPWDVDYDPTSDTAYVALTNGTVAVFDAVVEQLNAGMSSISTESRLIQPAVSGSALAGPTNLHGIDYVPEQDALIVSDVASPTDATDGKLMTIANASAANGLTEVSALIAGSASQLGNPVDLVFDGQAVFVAEKSNAQILRFDNIFASSGGDIAPAGSIAFTAPESVALMPTQR